MVGRHSPRATGHVSSVVDPRCSFLAVLLTGPKKGTHRRAPPNGAPVRPVPPPGRGSQGGPKCRHTPSVSVTKVDDLGDSRLSFALWPSVACSGSDGFDAAFIRSSSSPSSCALKRARPYPIDSPSVSRRTGRVSPVAVIRRPRLQTGPTRVSRGLRSSSPHLLVPQPGMSKRVVNVLCPTFFSFLTRFGPLFKAKKLLQDTKKSRWVDFGPSSRANSLMCKFARGIARVRRAEHRPVFARWRAAVRPADRGSSTSEAGSDALVALVRHGGARRVGRVGPCSRRERVGVASRNPERGPR